MSIRDEFERWFLTRGGHSDDLAPDGQGGYMEYETELYWEGWQASRAAIVITLPRGGYWAGYENAYMLESQDVVDALTDVGLTVNP